jgi:thiamine biosynthesis lipoprotein
VLAALLTTLLLASPPAGWQASAQAFGEVAQIEVRDLDATAAEVVLRAAMVELVAAEADAVAITVRLNAAAGRDPVQLDGTALKMLRRTLDFCLWSDGAHGPLGGVLYELWQQALPPAAALVAARETSGCDRLLLDEESGTARLAAGSRIDLRGFATGWAVDRAIEILRDHGVANGRVRVGRIERALGAGPSGRGWAIELDLPPEWLQPLAQPRLQDRALAMASHEPAMVIAGDRYAVHLDLRTGRPATGVAATIAVSELAIDAQALSIALFVLGQREGMMRLGSLRPEPSIAWLLGSGEGLPLLTTHRWSAAD